MSLNVITIRWTAVMALGLTSLAALAPAANAGHGNNAHYKWRRSDDSAPRFWGSNLPSQFGYRTRYEVRGPSHCAPRYGGGYTRVVVRERSSSVGPALAGLVGGFILGSAVAHSSDHSGYGVQVQAGSYYYDPYCGDRFSSLDACYSHYVDEGCNHPPIVEVIDARSGRCTGKYDYEDGRWRTYDGDVYYDREDGGDRYRDRCDHHDRDDDDD